MYNYYKLDIIPIILNKFNVKDIIISGLSDKKIINQILKYCENKDISVMNIGSKDNSQFDFKNQHPLNAISELNNYGAIFLNDDPNWYTVYTELNLIKQNNKEFPLVFICHNIFPHKRRDSYINPDLIPNEYINDFSEDLEYGGIHLFDGLFHAIDEGTPKNGVLTAIEDFISQNTSIEVMDINFLNGITILCPKNFISQIKLGSFTDEIEEHILDNNFSDNIIESQILIDYFSKFKISPDDGKFMQNFKKELEEKEKLIKDYDAKIEINNAELEYKDSQINNFTTELSLKDSKIKHVESKLTNYQKQIDDLNNQVKVLKSELTGNAKLKDEELKRKDEELVEKERDFNSIRHQYESQLEELGLGVKLKDEELKRKDEELVERGKDLNSIKQQYESQLYKLDKDKYCISCFKEEICNNHLEIEYLKKNSLIKKILSPFSYIYLIFKSNPRELSLNFKLYKALKYSKCFDIGYYLNNNPDLINSNFCKYFSPELHFVCNGFNENRKFNKKYFNRNSKIELLEYILTCK